MEKISETEVCNECGRYEQHSEGLCVDCWEEVEPCYECEIYTKADGSHYCKYCQESR